jgi:hypothetical protein
VLCKAKHGRGVDGVTPQKALRVQSSGLGSQKLAPPIARYARVLLLFLLLAAAAVLCSDTMAWVNNKGFQSRRGRVTVIKSCSKAPPPDRIELINHTTGTQHHLTPFHSACWLDPTASFCGARRALFYG